MYYERNDMTERTQNGPAKTTREEHLYFLPSFWGLSWSRYTHISIVITLTVIWFMGIFFSYIPQVLPLARSYN